MHTQAAAVDAPAGELVNLLGLPNVLVNIARHLDGPALKTFRALGLLLNQNPNQALNAAAAAAPACRTALQPPADSEGIGGIGSLALDAGSGSGSGSGARAAARALAPAGCATNAVAAVTRAQAPSGSSSEAAAAAARALAPVGCANEPATAGGGSFSARSAGSASPGPRLAIVASDARRAANEAVRRAAVRPCSVFCYNQDDLTAQSVVWLWRWHPPSK